MLNFIVILTLAILATPAAKATLNDRYAVDDPLKTTPLLISQVWAGTPVATDMITRKKIQCFAYYGEDRFLRVSCRKLGSSTLQTIKLDTKVGWDSHNSVTLEFDKLGYLHIAGNMHISKLNYFRSTIPVKKPSDVLTIVRFNVMVNTIEESQATYPRFLKAKDKSLLFIYRYGGSGDGDTIINQFNTDTGQWFRLNTQPIFLSNPSLPTSVYYNLIQKNGESHLIFVWRRRINNKSIPQNNVKLSYLRTKNFRDFYNIKGSLIPLPIKFEDDHAIDSADGAGIMNYQINLTYPDKPVVAYHRYDAAGKSQVYTAQFDGSQWNKKVITSFTHRWDLSSTGSIPNMFDVGVWSITHTLENSVEYINVLVSQQLGEPSTVNGFYQLDEGNLNVLSVRKSLPVWSTILPEWPACDSRIKPTPVENTFVDPVNGDKMLANYRPSHGNSSELFYYFRWESLPSRYDRPRVDLDGSELIVPPSKLTLHKTNCVLP